MCRKPIRNGYPLLYAYGAHHTFLDNETATAAPLDARIRSIWPFLVRRVLNFQRTLGGSERVNFDPEDTLAELWVALAERDHKWNPERGRYLTFAGTIISRELCSIRDRARTVESPRNSSCRMKEYLEEEAAGTISPQRRKTMSDIRRTGDGPTSLSNDRGDIDLPTGDDSDPLRAHRA